MGGGELAPVTFLGEKSLKISINIFSILKSSTQCIQINLFINSDAILNRDALWSIQGKKHYLQDAIVGGIHHR